MKKDIKTLRHRWSTKALVSDSYWTSYQKQVYEEAERMCGAPQYAALNSETSWSYLRLIWGRNTYIASTPAAFQDLVRWGDGYAINVTHGPGSVVTMAVYPFPEYHTTSLGAAGQWNDRTPIKLIQASELVLAADALEEGGYTDQDILLMLRNNDRSVVNYLDDVKS